MRRTRLLPGFIIISLVFFLFVVHADRSLAGAPPAEPILRIETGMHTAPIRRLGVDRAGHFLVTASEDKTARVWDLASGRLLLTLRPPINSGNDGQLYAVAISPDGETVACGGWTGYDWARENSIYIFERQSGRLVKRIGGLPSLILHLAYTKDGRHLLATLQDKYGLKIYRLPEYSLAASDPDYPADVLGADFDQNGRLVTSCFDGIIRLYDQSFKLITQKKVTGGSRPFSVAFSPDGAKVAVGFDDTPKVVVLSGQNLSPLYSPPSKEIKKGALAQVAWSADGQNLYAGGSYVKNGVRPIIKWPKEGQGPSQELPGPRNTVMHLWPLPAGGVVYCAGDPAWGVISADDQKLIAQEPTVPDYRGLLDKFLLARDGGEVQFSYQFGGRLPAIFSISKRELTINPPGPVPGLSTARLSAAGLTITDWEDHTAPKLNNKPLTLTKYEQSRSLAVLPDGTGLLLGADWAMHFFNREGKEEWKANVPGTAWAVNVTENGKVGAAAFADGSIGWRRLADGKELLNFFPHRDQKRWVLWSPSGYYDASPGGEDLIGWHLNRGPDQEADFFPASRFRSTFYRPDVVARLLETLDEAEAFRSANIEAKRTEVQKDVTKMLPPVVRILSPDDGAPVSSTEVTIKFLVRSPGQEPVIALKVLLDGRPAPAERGLTRKQEGQEAEEREIKVTIPERDVEVGLIAENRHAAGQPALVRLTWRGRPQAKDIEVIKPKLYILAVGVGAYEDKQLDLQFPAKDARDFVAVISKQKGEIYQDVLLRLLTDAQATKDAILDGLEWIERQTTAKDVAMIFIAGHGENDDKGNYYFLPANTRLDSLRRTGLPWTEVHKTVSSLAGKTLCFVDTCHAGSVMGQRRGQTDINAIVNELTSAEKGAVVFASSMGKQYSLEDNLWQNGAFTKALVEGLAGKADLLGKGKITISSLESYLSERVKELTKGRQTPTTTKPATIPDFAVAVVTDSKK